MPFTTITKPAIGDPTKKSFADAVVDNLNYLYNQLLAAIGTREIILNGSFEVDSDADGFADGWSLALHNGGTWLLDESTSAADDKSIHGNRSAKLTSPGGGGNGGGTLTSIDHIEISDSHWVGLFWQLKSSVAGVHNLVEITWYASDLGTISTSILWSEAVNNPTSWTPMFAYALPPDNARYCKIRLTGCDDDDTTAGSTWFDDVRMVVVPGRLNRKVEWTTAGDYRWKCPSETRFVAATVIGGGGSGAGVNGGNAGAGGGSGGSAFGIIPVTPGTIYTVTVGAGGAAGGTGNDGNPGTTSTFETISCGGGGGGVQLAGAAGAGGSASGGTIRQTGEAGNTRTSTSIGGDGGGSVWFGTKSVGGGVATQPTPPYRYGAASGGAGTAANTVAGADGTVILEF